MPRLLLQDGGRLTAEDGGLLLLEGDGGTVVVHDGPSVVHALQAWWARQTAIHAMLRPVDSPDADVPPLWHVEADRPDPPFVVCFTVSETEAEDRTTTFQALDALIQINVHAETDHQALMTRRPIRAAPIPRRRTLSRR